MPLDDEFRFTVHEIYILILKDECKVFALFQHDVLLLLARLDICLVPSLATADFIGIFDLLLSEITKRYDDYSVEFESVLQRTSKIMGVFLIGCLKYSLLSLQKMEQICSFVLKLTQYYLTLTELVEYWFTTALKEPDIMYEITQKSLQVNCFPIYELTRDFLFMEEKLAKPAKDTLLHIILISCFSPSLQQWVLQSDFPNIILTGLLSCFNQICYSDSIVTKVGVSIDEVVQSNPSFCEFDEFMKFFMNLISYSSDDSVKIAFLNGFHTRFMIPVLEYFSGETQHHSNVFVLFTYTLERLILPSESHRCTCTLIIGFLLDKYFDPHNSEHYIVDLYVNTLLDYRDCYSVIPTFKLLSILSRANSPELLKAVLFTEPIDGLRQHPDSLNALASRARSLISTDSELSGLLVSSLEVFFAKLRSQQALLNDPKILIMFDTSSILGSIVCIEFYGFFTQGIAVNEQLTWMIMDLVSANCGYVVNLLCDDSEQNVFAEILEYLWRCYTEYSFKLRQGYEQIHSVRPGSALLAQLRSLSPLAQERLQYKEQAAKAMIPPLLLQQNVDLFGTLCIRLYALQRASFTLHKVRYGLITG